jgi:hypothetical protein
MATPITWRNVANTVTGNPAAALTAATSAFAVAGENSRAQVKASQEREKLDREALLRRAQGLALDEDGFTAADRGQFEGQDLDYGALTTSIDASTLSGAQAGNQAAQQAQAEEVLRVSGLKNTPENIAAEMQRQADESTANINQSVAATARSNQLVSQGTDLHARTRAGWVTADNTSAALKELASAEDPSKVDLTKFDNVNTEVLTEWMGADATRKAQIARDLAATQSYEQDLKWKKLTQTEENAALERETKEAENELAKNRNNLTTTQLEQAEKKLKEFDDEYDKRIQREANTAKLDAGFNATIDSRMEGLRAQRDEAIAVYENDPNMSQQEKLNAISNTRQAYSRLREDNAGVAALSYLEDYRSANPEISADAISASEAGKLVAGDKAAMADYTRRRQDADLARRETSLERWEDAAATGDLINIMNDPATNQPMAVSDEVAKGNKIDIAEATQAIRDTAGDSIFGWGKKVGMDDNMPQEAEDRLKRLIKEVGYNKEIFYTLLDGNLSPEQIDRLGWSQDTAKWDVDVIPLIGKGDEITLPSIQMARELASTYRQAAAVERDKLKNPQYTAGTAAQAFQASLPQPPGQ